ncbi:hypothetical protein EV121DRAFT_206537 [Schizophyllum commune]
MRLSTVALTVAAMFSMARAQIDPGVVDICVNNVCEPSFPDFAECVCDIKLASIEHCVWDYWSSFPEGPGEFIQAVFIITEWCSTHYYGASLPEA